MRGTYPWKRPRQYRAYALTCSPNTTRNGMQERRTVYIHRNVLAEYAHTQDSIIATRRGWPRLRRADLEHDSPCSDVTRDATPYFSPLRKCLFFPISPHPREWARRSSSKIILLFQIVAKSNRRLNRLERSSERRRKETNQLDNTIPRRKDFCS